MGERLSICDSRMRLVSSSAALRTCWACDCHAMPTKGAKINLVGWLT